MLTVSDGVVAGTREDRSGDTLEELLRADGYDVERRVVPDERDQIAGAIRELAAGARLVLTTGGTGLTPRDVTPPSSASTGGTRGTKARTIAANGMRRGITSCARSGRSVVRWIGKFRCPSRSFGDWPTRHC